MLRRRIFKHSLQAAEGNVKLLYVPVLLQVLFSVRGSRDERRTSVLSFFQHLGSISWLSFHCSGNQIFQPPPRKQRGPLLTEWPDTVRERERDGMRWMWVRGTAVLRGRSRRTALKEEEKTEKSSLWTQATTFLPVNTETHTHSQGFMGFKSIVIQ